jgi:hypothetical protein
MEKTNEKVCACEKASCGCAGAKVAPCRCGEDCSCQPTCTCGGCDCADAIDRSLTFTGADVSTAPAPVRLDACVHIFTGARLN